MIVDCGIYDGGVRRAGTFTFEEAYEASKAPGTFVWLGLYEPTPGEFASVKTAFELHELAVEDALKAHQRPKVEVYDDTLFIVVKTARYVDPEEAVTLGELLLFAGPNFVVAVRHGEASPLVETRKRVEKRPDLLKCGPGAVLWAILDHVVDDYLPVLGGLEHDIDQVESEVFSSGKENPAERIYFLKREVMEFLRGVRPLLDPLDRLARGTFPLIHADVHAYFRDVHDHTLRVVEELEGDRDLLTSVLQSNLTSGLDPAERGHAEDLGVGGDSRRADDDRGDLRDELPAHARAEVPLGVSLRARAHAGRLRGALSRVQAFRLAIAVGSAAVAAAHRALLAVGGDPAVELRPLLGREDRVDLGPHGLHLRLRCLAVRPHFEERGADGGGVRVRSRRGRLQGLAVALAWARKAIPSSLCDAKIALTLSFWASVRSRVAIAARIRGRTSRATGRRLREGCSGRESAGKTERGSAEDLLSKGFR